MHSGKSAFLVLTEATFVGILLVILFSIVSQLMKKQSVALRVFLSGAIFHCVCEVTGLNTWYAREYCKLLRA